MKKLLFAFVIIFSAQMTNAQLTVHKAVHVGYAYQNQSFGEIGARLLMLKTDDVVYRVGAAALMGSVNGEFAVMPKVQGDILFNFQRNVDLYHSVYWLVGAEATTKYVAPKAGVSLFGLIDLTGGYGFSLDEKGLKGKKLEGLNINFTLNLPVVMLYELFQ